MAKPQAPSPAVETLAEVLRRSASLHLTHTLYLKGVHPYDVRSVCAVLDDSQLEAGGVPEFARRNFLKPSLTAEQVQQVVLNARMQLKDPAADRLVEAFNYFVARDEFIVWEPE